MFFLLSKICWALLSTSALVLFLLVAGTVAYGFGCARGAARFFVAAATLFIVFGATAAGDDLLASLEAKARPVLPSHVDGILILGGAFDTNLSADNDVPVMNADTQRILEGVRLARLYPDAQLVFSGGEGTLRPTGTPEARDVTMFLKRYQLTTPQTIIYEARSRNTLENFERTRELFHPIAGQHWILVTSAFHMKRALAAARLTHWPAELIPWPTAWRTDGRLRLLPRNFYIVGNFSHADMALHEYVGLLVYWFMGIERKN